MSFFVRLCFVYDIDDKRFVLTTAHLVGSIIAVGIAIAKVVLQDAIAAGAPEVILIRTQAVHLVAGVAAVVLVVALEVGRHAAPVQALEPRQGAGAVAAVARLLVRAVAAVRHAIAGQLERHAAPVRAPERLVRAVGTLGQTAPPVVRQNAAFVTGTLNLQVKIHEESQKKTFVVVAIFY